MDRHIYRDYINLWMNDVNEEMQPQQNESQTTLIQALGVTKPQSEIHCTTFIGQH